MDEGIIIGIMVLFGLISLGFFAFMIYYVFKQMQFFLTATNLYKTMIQNQNTIIEILRDNSRSDEVVISTEKENETQSMIEKEKDEVVVESEKIHEGIQFASRRLENIIRREIRKFEGVILESDLKGLTNLAAMGKDAGKDATGGKIIDLSGIEYCTALQRLDLRYNQISDISPLVNNSGIGEGTGVNVRENPLNDEAYSVHIPALQERGVSVRFDPKPGE